MKNLKSILFVIAILVSNTAFPGDDKSNLKSLSKKVQSVLKTPEAIKAQHTSQTVTIYFSVNENGDVTDVLACTDNKQIKQDVENQFRCMNFKGLKPSVTNSIDVHFVVY
jgi:predicted dinucleotide-binding enzyme